MSSNPRLLKQLGSILLMRSRATRTSIARLHVAQHAFLGVVRNRSRSEPIAIPSGAPAALNVEIADQ